MLDTDQVVKCIVRSVWPSNFGLMLAYSLKAYFFDGSFCPSPGLWDLEQCQVHRAHCPAVLRRPVLGDQPPYAPTVKSMSQSQI